MYNELAPRSTVILQWTVDSEQWSATRVSAAKPHGSSSGNCFSIRWLPIIEDYPLFADHRVLTPSSCGRGCGIGWLCQVGDGQVLGTFEIGNGPSDLENAVVGARGQALLLHGALQQALGVLAQFAVGANLAVVICALE